MWPGPKLAGVNLLCGLPLIPIYRIFISGGGSDGQRLLLSPGVMGASPYHTIRYITILKRMEGMEGIY